MITDHNRPAGGIYEVIVNLILNNFDNEVNKSLIFS